MVKKYQPTIGDEIEFYHNKEKNTGIVEFVGAYVVSVYPHTIDIKGFDGSPVLTDWWVEKSDIIGEIKGV